MHSFRTATAKGRLIMAQKQVSCDCGKVIREPTDDQLIANVQRHAKEVHNMELSREQVLAMAEPL
jgi:predicted small metal-binding protein